jgi:hypothetical protein
VLCLPPYLSKKNRSFLARHLLIVVTRRRVLQCWLGLARRRLTVALPLFSITLQNQQGFLTSCRCFGRCFDQHRERLAQSRVGLSCRIAASDVFFAIFVSMSIFFFERNELDKFDQLGTGSLLVKAQIPQTCCPLSVPFWVRQPSVPVPGHKSQQLSKAVWPEISMDHL